VIGKEVLSCTLPAHGSSHDEADSEQLKYQFVVLVTTIARADSHPRSHRHAIRSAGVVTA